MSEQTIAVLLENVKLMQQQLIDDKLERSDAEKTFNRDDFWRNLVDAGRRVSHEATKMCLSFSKPPLPDAHSSETLCRSLEVSCLALISSFYGYPKQQGLSLKRQLRQRMSQILQAVSALIVDIRDCEKKKEKARVQLATGGVWEACERLEKLPKDNKTAILMLIGSHDELVKDALRELDHAIKEAAEEEEDEAGENKEDDEQQVWSSSEKAIAVSALGLVKTAHTCMKKTTEMVAAKGSGLECQGELDNVALRSQCVSPAVDDFVSTLYPPMRRGIVMENASEVAVHLRSLLNSLKECHWFCAEDLVWWEFLYKAVDHNLAKVENLTGKSRSG